MLLLPSAADGQGTAISRALTSASTLCQVEPVGRWFEAFVKRRNRNASASFQELEDKKELSEESEDEELQLEEFPMLKTLDPKDWKNQDHYAVLGLGHVRYKATQRQIKAALFFGLLYLIVNISNIVCSLKSRVQDNLRTPDVYGWLKVTRQKNQ
uniref:DnaJ heat shock protein family (Hsp40) member C2 n=1 Tax=Equus caballus TaxID=9796 RepID=A0A9L0TIA3_HORSE